MNRKLSILKITLLASLILSVTIYAQPMRTGKTIATAGACGGAMFGVQAAGWNPANLGLSANPGYSFYLPLSVGTSVGNNSFSPDYITKTFVKGDTLSAGKKKEILGKLDADDFRLYSYAGVPVIGMSLKSNAFNVESFAFANAKMPSEIFDLSLNGPLEDKYYELKDIESEAIGYVAISYSVAKAFTPPHKSIRELSFGATFKYVYGVAGGVLNEHTGHILISREAINAEGKFRYLLSERGDGIGLDLGVSGIIDPLNMYVGLALGNLIGNINWTETQASDFEFWRLKGIEIDSVTTDGYWERFFHNNDTTYAAGDFTTPLPRYFLLSGQKSFANDNVDLFLSWYQGLNKSSGHSQVPKISLGTELRYIKFLPIRFGFGLGGVVSTQYAFGFGFNTPVWQMSIGASWARGIAFGANGFSISLTNYFGKSYKRPERAQQTLRNRADDFAALVRTNDAASD